MTVAHITPHLTTLRAPDAIADLPAWLIWRFEPADSPGGKPRKVPYYSNGRKRTGQQGRPEDREQLVTFEAARNAAARRGFDGVGFAPMAEFGIVALDFDGCVTGGRVHPEVAELVSNTYAEFSPSGQGVRAFLRGQLGNSKSHAQPGTFGVELFSSKGFVTFTGNLLPGCDLVGSENTIAPVDEPILRLVRRRFQREAPAVEEVSDVSPVGLTASQIEEALTVLDPDMGHQDWLQVGMALHHETGGQGFHYWDDWSATGAKYPGGEKLMERWASFGRASGQPVTARTLVRMANEAGAHIDLRAAAASAADFDAAVEAAQDNEKPSRFTVLPADAFADRDPPQWIVKGVVPRAELMVLYGESGSGKSFLALDIAMAIARGEPWRGHRVRQGRVVYVAAEGAGGFRNRLKAYQIEHQVDLARVPFGVVHAAPNLLSTSKGKVDSDTVELARAIGKADVVIVDTFAQTTPGANENSAEDMGQALAHCKVLHRATGALVVLVHHAGKDPTKGARGWSGIKAAADAEIEVVRDGDFRAARVSKQKDGEDGQAWGFRLRQVPIGVDEDDEIVTSCVVEEAEVPKTTRTRKLGDVERVVVEVVNEMAEAQTAGIEVKAVLEEAKNRLPKTEGKDTRMQRVKRALASLSEGDEALYFWDKTDDTLEVC